MNIKAYSFFKFLTTLMVVVIICASVVKPIKVSADWGMKNSKKTFYSLDVNSLDILFVGSSVSAAAINPYQLYEEQGINSYNLAGIAEPMNCTYFWLKEALMTQNPKVVFIEVQTAVRTNKKKEEKSRKNLEWMRHGLTKIEFAIKYCEENDEAKLEECLFPINWKEFFLSFILRPDLSYLPNNKSVTKGFAAQTNISGIEYDGIELNTNAFADKYYEPYYEYLAKAIKLCKKRNIDVVLYKTPETSWSTEKHNLVQSKADEYKVPFVDLNLKSIMDKIKFDYSKDSDDGMHVNMNGARKISSYIATYINNNFELEDIRGTDKAISYRTDMTEFQKYMMDKEKALGK